MSVLDEIGGRATGGTLYGIGVGPGDVRLMTLRAAALVSSVDVVAHFAKRGRPGNARQIVAPLMSEGRAELRLDYPVTDETPVTRPEYKRQIGSFYRECADQIAALLGAGRSVGLIAEGDPFLYGSFMHMWRRLADEFPCEVVAGVTGMSGCWSRAGVPIAWGDDVLTVLPGTLAEDELVRRLSRTDAAVIMKVGRHLAKIQRALTAANMSERAVYVERGTMPGERILPLSACDSDMRAPYFALVLVPGLGRRL